MTEEKKLSVSSETGEKCPACGCSNKLNGEIVHLGNCPIRYPEPEPYLCKTLAEQRGRPVYEAEKAALSAQSAVARTGATPRTETLMEALAQLCSYDEFYRLEGTGLPNLARQLERELWAANKARDALASALSSDALKAEQASYRIGYVDGATGKTPQVPLTEGEKAVLGTRPADGVALGVLLTRVEQIIKAYAESYREMGRLKDSDGTVMCESVKYDLLNNIMPQVCEAVRQLSPVSATRENDDNGLDSLNSLLDAADRGKRG